MNINTIIIDNFYSGESAMETREHALTQNFHVTGNFPGKRTSPVNPGLKDYIQNIVRYAGGEITNFDYEYNTAYQYTTNTDTSWIHADQTSTWAGVCYLTPHAPVETGTELFMHKATGNYKAVKLKDNSYDESTMMMDVLVSVGPDALAGFQFNISGLTGITAFGGIAGDAGWTVSASDEVVLGFDLQGSTIAAGTSGVLTTLMATAIDAESCMSAVVMSDADGAAVEYQVGGCVPLCDDIDMDGICDSVDDCVGEYDDCDVCNGDGTSCLNVIYFGAVTESADGNTMEVWISTVDDVAGFQFDVSGAELTGASGGVAGDVGFVITAGHAAILGFAMPNAPLIPAGSGLLTVLDIADYSTATTACLSNLTVSDADGDALATLQIFKLLLKKDKGEKILNELIKS